MRLRTKLVGSVVFGMILINLHFFVSTPHAVGEAALTATVRRAASAAAILSAAAKAALRPDQPENRKLFEDLVREDSDLLFVHVEDQRGIVQISYEIGPHAPIAFAGFGQETRVQSSEVHVQVPLEAAPGPVVFRAGFTLSQVTAATDRAKVLVAKVGAVLLLFSGILAVVIGTILYRPIGALIRELEPLRQGQINLRLKIEGRDEVADLARAFNDMLESLQQSVVSRAHLDRILASIVDTLLVVDPEGEIQICNQATCQLLEMQPDEIVGRPFARLLSVEPEAEGLLHKVIQEGFIHNCDVSYLTRSGSAIPMHLSGSILRDAGGTLSGIVLVGRDMRHILELMSAVESAGETERRQAQQLAGALGKLERAHYEMAQSHQTLQQTQSQLLEASRQAGMAEVATSVLHNVGNVFNSVNVSTHLVRDLVTNSEVRKVGMSAELLERNADRLAEFLTVDPRGRRLPEFLSRLAKLLIDERDTILKEIESLTKNIDHIKQIIVTQQRYARPSGVLENVSLAEVLDTALGLAALGDGNKYGIHVERDYGRLPPILIDRHKMIQILVNLLTNARQALREAPERRISLRTRCTDPDRVLIEVRDSGVGIEPENLTRMFALGFTTKPDGHGFGLHASANAAREMGGSLSARSDGPGRGACFVLELPFERGGPEQPARPVGS